MLQLIIDDTELFDNNTQTFTTIKKQVINLEHSLVSVSKWESKWKKPFITKERKTRAETIDYIKCMTITQNVNPLVYNAITSKQIKEIDKYIGDSMSATTFTDRKNSKSNREIVTSELIYYWMVAFQIPFECQKWHLNRLLTLIRICNIKNQSPKKMSKKETMMNNKSLNAQRRQMMNSRG